MSITLLWIVLISYLTIVWLIGYVTYRRSQTTAEDFYLGSRGFGIIALTLTLAATILSSFFYLGVAGAMVADGLPWLFGLILWQLFTVLGMLYVGTRVWRLGKEFGHITPADLISDYYDNSSVLRLLGPLIFIVAAFPFMILQMKGAGLAMETLTSGTIPANLGILLFTVIALIYVLAGGVRAVVWTDVLQGAYFLGLLVIIGLVTAFVIMPSAGIESTWSASAQERPDFLTFPGAQGAVGWQLLISLAVFTGLTNIGQPAILQRFLMARSVETLRTSALLYLALVVPVSLVIGYITFAALLVVTPEAPDMLFPTLLAEFLPIFSAFFIVGVIAAGMSTVDSLLITLSSMLSIDVVRGFFRVSLSDRVSANLGRIFIVIMTAIAYLLALRTPTALAQLAVLMVAWVGCVLIPLIGPLMWSRGTKVGAIAALVVGSVAVAVTTFYVPSPLGFTANMWGPVLGAITFVVVSLFTKPVSEERQARFRAVLGRGGYAPENGRSYGTEPREQE
jgi:SSS family solute:Na+ symporter